MADVSIALKLQDNFSQAILGIKNAVTPFRKDLGSLQKELDKLDKTKIAWEIDFTKAKSELKDATKILKSLGSTATETERATVEADFSQAMANYENIRQQLSMLSQQAKETERDMLDATGAISKADNRAGRAKGNASGSKASGMLSALGKAGLIQMGGDVASQWANILVGSSFGQEAGTYFSGALSGAASGAAMGSLMGPAGTAIGGIAGGVIGTVGAAGQVYEKKDDYFKQYYADLYNQAAEGTASGITTGSDYSSQMEQYNTSFRVMTGSAEEAAVIVKRITEIAASTPFSQEDLVATTQSLMQTGMNQDSALGKTTMLGDISQGNAEKMKLMADAYGKMSAAGKVSLERINQMTDAGFNPLNEISKSTGESVSSLYDRISKGSMTVDEITASMERATSEGGMFYQSMQLQAETFKGLKSTLDDTMSIIEGGYGRGYNPLREEGFEQQITAYSGPLGDALESMNAVIGAGQAYLENLSDQYLREAQSALLLGSKTSLYDGEHEEKLQDYHQQYTSLMSEYESASDARKAEISDNVQALKEQVESMSTAAYESSSQYSNMIQAENDKISATRDLTASFNSFKIKYAKDENLSKGQGDVDTPPSLPVWGRWGPKAFGQRRVPYNGFRALLHEGERVLTASEARNYDSNSSNSTGVTIGGNNFYVREDADIDRIANALADRILLARMGGAGP